jgi:YidC/Oxa1 family membrane protein insertase
MPNSSGGAPQPPQQPQPPSLEKRLPLALALMLLVLVASQYLLKPPQGPKPAQPVNDEHAAALSKPVPKTAKPAALPAIAAPIHATAAATVTVDTDLYRVIFSNRGAVVTSWVLKRYTDEMGKPLQLINPLAKDLPPPFSLEINGPKPDFDPNTVLYQQNVTNNGLHIEYVYSDGKTTITKSFDFSQDSYRLRVRSSVVENGALVPAFLMWRGGFGDQRIRNAAAVEHTVLFNTATGKLETQGAKAAKNGPITSSGDYTFAGLEDNFFAAVALPENASRLEIRTYSDELKIPGEDKPVPYVGAGFSTGTEDNFSMYVGPKDINILKKVNPNLAKIIDWGFFGIIAKPIFYWLNWTKEHWTGNYGWAIVVLTLIINLALFPLRLSSLKSARKMQRIQPLIKAINDKYKNISLRDPRKAQQNQEIMELYKREGINPFGGCLPMLVQLPILYAFYRVLYVAIELRHAPWLWVSDLSSPETLPIHLLPVILVVTQFYSQKLTPAAGVDPKQQRMMLMMPVIFGFMFYYLPSGLVLYYLTSNLVGIAQQLVINRFMPAPTSPAAPAPAKARAANVSPGKSSTKTVAKAPVKRAGKK